MIVFMCVSTACQVSKTKLFCFVLFCSVLFCFVLFCFVLFCFVLFICLIDLFLMFICRFLYRLCSVILMCSYPVAYDQAADVTNIRWFDI